MAERKRRSERSMMAQGYVPQQQPTSRQQEHYQQGTYRAQGYQQQAYQPTSFQPLQNRSAQQANQYHETKAKRSNLLMISGIVGLAYFIYIVAYIINTANTISAGDTMESAAQAIGTGLAIAMVTPHIIIAGFAVLFNVLGWALNKAGFALTGGILYCVAGFLMFMYIPFILPSLVLSFIGYSKLHKARR